MISGSLTAYAGYLDVYGNLSQESVDTDAFGDRPSKVEGAVNIMLIGSDVRSGDNGNYGKSEGERPDSLVIAHISPNQDGATLINLPRDSVVDLPACEPADDKPGMQAQRGMINSAMSLGGVPCQWKAVEQLTGIHIDHFVSIDFTGFKDIVDSIDGVDMCIPEPIDDDKAHLKLGAGRQTLSGEEALGYVRSRYGQGDGSDISRIDRQQEFMGAMLKKVMSGDTMQSPTNLYGFLKSTADTITTDDELTLTKMTDLSIAMREVDMGQIKFVTVPNGPDPADPNRIAWTEPDAGQLFKAVAEDTKIDAGEKKGGEGKKGGGGGGGGKSEKPTVPAEQVTVEVVNGTEVSGLANEVSEKLGGEGFSVAGTGNPNGEVPSTTTVYYGPGQKEHAKTVAASAKDAKVEENPALGTTVQLVIAGDWDGMDGGQGGGVPDSAKGKTAADAKDACG
ncbi:LCP family protein [Murinocardiopsis flavida]|nr:LCP family protein [Murinocardiopsis flavida]